MLRAFAKGVVQAGFGHVPGGTERYRYLTHELMGTQASHVDKLRRVVPGYVGAWRALAGIELGGLDVWIHEAGCTPFWALAG